MKRFASGLTLGIESSCDETAVAILKDGRTLLSSEITSQMEIHRPFGGVVPEVASRNHLEVIRPLCETALQRAGCTVHDISQIACTQGPGLVGALLVGATFAKGMAAALSLPLVPVNHVHAHVHGALLSFADLVLPGIFPAIALVVSGGHTHIYRMESLTDFKLLGWSLDDACGESFDKVAKFLGLSYPGGPKIEALAKLGRTSAIKMPRMIEQKGRLEFSYSGLKTFVYNWLQQRGHNPNDTERADIAAAFQEEALGQICRKVKAALDLHRDTRSVIVAGGVAANLHFQQLLNATVNEASPTAHILFPRPDFCSDNAAMIASLGAAQLAANPERDYSQHDWDCFPRYPYLST